MIWPLDAWLDVNVFSSAKDFIQSFWMPAPEQIWMRGLAAMQFLALAVVCRGVATERPGAYFADGNQRVSIPGFSRPRYVDEQIRLRALAYRDYLTGLYNRRRIEELLVSMHQTEQLKQGGLAVLFCDIDHFKRVNTRFGHPAGDEVLTKLADVFRQHFRRGDAVGRWGGEEFLIVLDNLNQSEAEEISEALRRRVQAEDFPHIGELTVSIGVAMLQPGEDTASLVKRADRALRQAKNDGRNCWRVCDCTSFMMLDDVQ